MITPKRLVPGVALGTSYANLYSVANAVTSVIKSMILCNTTTTTQAVSVQIRPPNGSDIIDANILCAMSIQPYETKVFGMTDVLPQGYSIWGKAGNASAVAITVSGMENT